MKLNLPELESKYENVYLNHLPGGDVEVRTFDMPRNGNFFLKRVGKQEHIEKFMTMIENTIQELGGIKK